MPAWIFQPISDACKFGNGRYSLMIRALLPISVFVGFHGFKAVIPLDLKARFPVHAATSPFW
jgi:hypothetical protein